MQADTLEKYIVQLPDERKQAIKKIRKVILENLPDGFTESMNYGMIGYVVSHSFYPGGYHCDPKQPLPFISIASQKNYIVLYHSGIYADTKIHDWFVTEYAKHCKSRLDMGKSCIRFKKIDEIPYKLIAELVRKMSSKEWIEIYETNIKR
ncbi:MAG: DUF1801 domain-containing protein [Bacteroidales bacterium]|nr:DUF1801 domain-containing protein [Bacteroidales bacterium]